MFIAPTLPRANRPGRMRIRFIRLPATCSPISGPTIIRVDSVNFWGGPSYRADEGYRWRPDHGVQHHRQWLTLTPDRLEEVVEWCEPAADGVLLRETRVLQTAVTTEAWTLRWTSEL